MLKVQTGKVPRAFAGQANEICEMAGNRAIVRASMMRCRAQPGDRGDSLQDGLEMMAFGRESMSGFPGGGVELANLDDAAAAEGEEQKAKRWSVDLENFSDADGFTDLVRSS